MRATHQRLLPSWLLAIVCGLLMTFSFQVSAQSGEESGSIEIPENLTHEEVRDLVARLSDDQVRELIIEQLDKVAAEQEPASAARTWTVSVS